MFQVTTVLPEPHNPVSKIPTIDGLPEEEKKEPAKKDKKKKKEKKADTTATAGTED
jgi:hypothetical protein